MIEIFRTWISLILSMGVIFCIIQIVMPNTKLKRYIYSLIGIVTVITLVSPVLKFAKNFNVGNVSDIFLNVDNAQTMSRNKDELSKFEEIKVNNVKENFKYSLEEDIRSKLKDKVEEFNIDVEITKDYNIEKIIIYLDKNSEYDITSFISTEYDITKDKIIVKVGG